MGRPAHQGGNPEQGPQGAPTVGSTERLRFPGTLVTGQNGRELRNKSGEGPAKEGLIDRGVSRCRCLSAELCFLVSAPQYVAKSLQNRRIVAFRWPGLIAELDGLIAEFGAHIAGSPKSRSSTPVSRIVRKALTWGRSRHRVRRNARPNRREPVASWSIAASGVVTGRACAKQPGRSAHVRAAGERGLVVDRRDSCGYLLASLIASRRTRVTAGSSASRWRSCVAGRGNSNRTCRGRSGGKLSFDRRSTPLRAIRNRLLVIWG